MHVKNKKVKKKQIVLKTNRLKNKLF